MGKILILIRNCLAKECTSLWINKVYLILAYKIITNLTRHSNVSFQYFFVLQILLAGTKQFNINPKKQRK